MSGIRPPDSSRDSAPPAESGRARSAEREPSRQVEEDAARLGQLMRRGRRANDAEVDPLARGRGEHEIGEGRIGAGPDDGRIRVGERGSRDGQGSGQGSGQEGEREREQPPTTPPGFRGDDILVGLGGPRIETPNKEEVKNRELSELVSGIVSRVLVGNRDGTPELRVTLAGELFGQTELTIARRDGSIEVTIAAGSNAAGDFLARSGNELAGHLAQRLETRVVIQVAPPEATDQSGAQDNRQDRRSRGLDALLTYVAG